MKRDYFCKPRLSIITKSRVFVQGEINSRSVKERKTEPCRGDALMNERHAGRHARMPTYEGERNSFAPRARAPMGFALAYHPTQLVTHKIYSSFTASRSKISRGCTNSPEVRSQNI